MPELPEVETVRRHLARCLPGAQVRRVRVLRDTAIAGLTPAAFARRVRGRTFGRPRRRGKVLFLPLDDGATLLVHLRMTGQLYCAARGAAPWPAHTRAAFELADGQDLLFVDSRTFGRIEWCAAGCVEASAALRNVGPDPLEGTSCLPALRAALAGRSANIKSFLLDQRRLAGLGNIYASEVLYRARISPYCRTSDLDAAAVRRLAAAIRAILQAAIKHCGTTISSYRWAGSRSGGFRRFLRVYGHAGERCPRRGCPGTIQRTKQAGRSTYWCPACQSETGLGHKQRSRRSTRSVSER